MSELIALDKVSLTDANNKEVESAEQDQVYMKVDLALHSLQNKFMVSNFMMTDECLLY